MMKELGFWADGLLGGELLMDADGKGALGESLREARKWGRGMESGAGEVF